MPRNWTGFDNVKPRTENFLFPKLERKAAKPLKSVFPESYCTLFVPLKDWNFINNWKYNAYDICLLSVSESKQYKTTGYQTYKTELKPWILGLFYCLQVSIYHGLLMVSLWKTCTFVVPSNGLKGNFVPNFSSWRKNGTVRHSKT